MSDIKKAPVKPTVTRFGRKFLVVHSTVARVDNKNVVVQLLKRPNKPHFFVVEGRPHRPTRCPSGMPCRSTAPARTLSG